MLDLLPQSSGRFAVATVFPPPPKFRPIEGKIKSARFLRATPPISSAMMTAAQSAGLRYEVKARYYLKEELPHVTLGAWFEFVDESGPRLCQIDGYSIESYGVLLFEIKRSHCLDAWFQLRQLYQLVLQFLYPSVPVRVVEICKSFDPNIQLPEPSFRLVNLHDFPRKDYFWVHKKEL